MKNEFTYLDEMIIDKSKAKDIYRPGKYWFERAERSSTDVRYLIERHRKGVWTYSLDQYRDFFWYN